MAMLMGILARVDAHIQRLKRIPGGLWTLDKGSLSQISQWSTEWAVVVGSFFSCLCRRK